MNRKHQALRISVILILGTAMSHSAFSEGTPTDESLIELAKTAILDVPFDTDAAISVETTNGLKKVVFPRKASQSSRVASPAQFAATVFIDPSTESVVPNPGLASLSDEQAIFIATNAIPIPFDHSKTVRVDRASSVTRVTLPDRNYAVRPGVVFEGQPRAWIWLDTETASVLWATLATR